jgi:hypothetical protein
MTGRSEDVAGIVPPLAVRVPPVSAVSEQSGDQGRAVALRRC